jgi:hypothetical protein
MFQLDKNIIRRHNLRLELRKSETNILTAQFVVYVAISHITELFTKGMALT